MPTLTVGQTITGTMTSTGVLYSYNIDMLAGTTYTLSFSGSTQEIQPTLYFGADFLAGDGSISGTPFWGALDGSITFRPLADGVFNLGGSTYTAPATYTVSASTPAQQSALGELIYGTTGNDTANGGNGDDAFVSASSVGNSGTDTFNGGEGADFWEYYSNAPLGAFNGGNGDDHFIAWATQSFGVSWTLNNSGLDSGPGTVFGLSSVERVDLYGGANGTDTINASAYSGTVLLFGRGGNDVLTGGSGTSFLYGDVGNDSLTGGTGNDTLDGGAGADALNGDAGNDTYIVDDAGDVVSEGLNAGADTVRTALSSYTLGANVENLTFTGSTLHFGDGNGLNNVIIGGSGADKLDGWDGRDELYGEAGDDLLFVYQTEFVTGEVVNGGSGHDTLFIGNNGAFDLSATTVSSIEEIVSYGDALSPGRQTLTISSDQIGAGFSSNLILSHSDVGGTYVGISLNILLTPSGSVDLSGISLPDWAPGQDTITITGSTGWNTLKGSSVADVLFGGAGNDTLDGSLGADTMNGGSGDDIYIVGAGDAVIETSLDDLDSVQTALASYTLSTNVENLTYTGSGGFIGGGNGANNWITGAGFNDYFYAHDGDDIANGYGGVDVFVLGNGNDFAYGGDDQDYFFGDAGDDTLHGEGGVDVFNGGDGADTMYGGEEADYFYGNEGSDLGLGEGGNDIFVMDAGNDTAHGNEGQDYFYMGDGDDSMYGGAGVDVMQGEAGNDLFDGGLGTDYLLLGPGGIGDNDTVIINQTASGIQVIYGFEAGGTNDVMRLTGTNFNNFSEVQGAITDFTAQGGFCVLTLDGDTNIWFIGVQPSQFTATDFTFV